jgi:hypothetical protein
LGYARSSDPKSANQACKSPSTQYKARPEPAFYKPDPALQKIQKLNLTYEFFCVSIFGLLTSAAESTDAEKTGSQRFGRLGTQFER